MAVCQYFLRGNCRFGDSCRFEHPTPGQAKQGNVCQHFLRGSCRFGDRCRFEHPGGGGHSAFGRGSTSSGFGGHRNQSWHRSGSSQSSGHVFGQNRFEALSGSDTAGGTFGHHQKAMTSRDTEHTPSQIQQTIRKDMEAWEANNQWPLSCYTFSKGPCIAGFLDYSPEELRLEAYKCNKEGKSAIYEQGLRELIGAHKQKRAQLKTMSTAQIHDVVVKSREGTVEDSGFSSIFGASNSQGTAGGLFSGVATSNQSGGFGSGTTQQSGGLFGSSSQSGGSMFGTTPQGSSHLFGSGSEQPHVGSSMMTEPPVFGTAPGSSQSGSALRTASSQSGTVFGTATSQSGTVFGTATSQSGAVFGTAPSQSGATFGTAPSQSVSAVFGSENSGTMGAAQPQFSAGQGQVTTSLEAKSVTNPAFSKYNEEDLAAFKAPMFTLGKIPECAPPPELC